MPPHPHSAAEGRLLNRDDRRRSSSKALHPNFPSVVGLTAVVLGVAVTRPDTMIVSQAMATAIGLAAASFASALRAFWVRSFATLPEPRGFYEEFAVREVEDTQLLLCNLAADAFERNEPHVRSKILWLKTSLLLLGGAVAAVLIAFYTGGMV